MSKLLNIEEIKKFLFETRRNKSYRFLQLKEMGKFTIGALGKEVDLELIVAYRLTQKKWLMKRFGCSEDELNFLFEVALYCLGYGGKLHQKAINAGRKLVGVYNRSNMKKSRY